MTEATDIDYNNVESFRKEILLALTELHLQNDRFYYCREIANVRELKYPMLLDKAVNTVAVKIGLSLSTLYKKEDRRILRERNSDVVRKGGTYLYRINPEFDSTTTI